MHYLHKILIHISDAVGVSDTNIKSPDSLRAALRSYAESETEGFCGQAFDWRETETAGGWSSQYPVNVLLATDDPVRFENELQEAMLCQGAEIQNCLANVTRALGTDLEQIVQVLTGETDRKDAALAGTAYDLACLAEHLCGKYRCDSCFYNTYSNTARLYASDLETIRKTPQDWAMALFDHHY